MYRQEMPVIVVPDSLLKDAISGWICDHDGCQFFAVFFHLLKRGHARIIIIIIIHSKYFPVSDWLKPLRHIESMTSKVQPAADY